MPYFAFSVFVDQFAHIWDMVAGFSRINTAKWRFSVHKMERRRRARPMNVTHPKAAGNKVTAALAVLALALMAANDQADAAPSSREYGYGFSACKRGRFRDPIFSRHIFRRQSGLESRPSRWTPAWTAWGWSGSCGAAATLTCTSPASQGASLPKADRGK